MKDYKLVFLPVSDDTTRLFENANQVDFFNAGTSNVILNGSRVIAPNTGFSFQAFPGEQDKTIYQIVFSGAGENNLIVTIKEYMN
jgi:hypothetical protein